MPCPIRNPPALTIQELIHEYIEQWPKPWKRFQQEYEHILKKEIAPHWGQLNEKEVTSHDVTLLLDKMISRV